MIKPTPELKKKFYKNLQYVLLVKYEVLFIEVEYVEKIIADPSDQPMGSLRDSRRLNSR